MAPLEEQERKGGGRLRAKPFLKVGTGRVLATTACGETHSHTGTPRDVHETIPCPAQLPVCWRSGPAHRPTVTTTPSREGQYSHRSLGKAKCSEHSSQSSSLQLFLPSALTPGPDHSTDIMSQAIPICHPFPAVSAANTGTLSPSVVSPARAQCCSQKRRVNSKETNTLLPTVPTLLLKYKCAYLCH